jgi:hypothetical protein
MLTPHEALDILRNHCQYSKGEDHIQAVFEAIWQQPTILSQPPTTTLVSLNPILREATKRFSQALHNFTAEELRIQEDKMPGWLLQVILCGHAPYRLLLGLLTEELAKKTSKNQGMVDAILLSLENMAREPLAKTMQDQIHALLQQKAK